MPIRPAYDAVVAERLTEEQVRHVAQLAQLQLTDDEIHTFTGQLGAILGHARDIEGLDIAQVSPATHAIPLVNVLREDVPRPSLDRDEVLASAPSAEDGRFRVPRILGEEQ